mmetsp:Transcript_247/g.598  ORF Transcript_247/g.598 Transcript_247/m.598 type:complete len:284 (+) Transcript_247:87-938(+)|eukprot:CAMPEP_0116837252 /NCGR_PEP_ID=MMETSP0418-20121206/8548_1 /TAXON_ID=1158023 /ORGANISM="Astrosyne radiata, Strain 13vi08-1A" /LENGTH=283 /DNA_ID=CAMNT_0004467111 /DNA_START=42 /DNA_END=893 /DNA_ORIENTATION=+
MSSFSSIFFFLLLVVAGKVNGQVMFNLKDDLGGNVGEEDYDVIFGENAESTDLSIDLVHMNSLKWYLYPPSHLMEQVRDAGLRHHIQSTAFGGQQPIVLTCRDKYVAKGLFEATAKNNKKGIALNARWGKEPTTDSGANKLTRNRPTTTAEAAAAASTINMNFDKAVRTSGTTVTLNLEVILPPYKTAKGKVLRPTLVYSIPMQRGRLNPAAFVTRNTATVSLYPKGKKVAGNTAKSRGRPQQNQHIPLGRSFVSSPIKSGPVDGNWARGKQFFRSGRPVGVI